MSAETDFQPKLVTVNRDDLGDMPVEDIRSYGYKLVDWMCEYFDSIESYPVSPNVKPGDIKRKLPDSAPVCGEGFNAIFDDFRKVILPGVTHWNHPNFNAYFSISSSCPGIFGELLSGILNVNGMLWKTCPSSTELEERVLEWLKKLLAIPSEFFGVIVDTASISSILGIAAAREHYSGSDIRLKGFPENTRLRMYCSDQAHSSIEKAAIVLGIGLKNVIKVESDDSFRMRPDILEEKIKADKAAGLHPFAVVATLGTTSTTSIDPIPEIGVICKRHSLWFHVDGAYAGVTSIIPEYRSIMDGFENVDSYVTNAHKWLFTPFDASLFFVRDEKLLRRTFSIIPDYLTTAESENVIDYMNYGVQLGRRFRSLKLWFVMRYFGEEGIVNRLREHIRLARLFQFLVGGSRDFELTAPVPFSVVCFRFNPAGIAISEPELESLNRHLMDEVNKTGKVYISHTVLKGSYTLRYAIGNIRTSESHVKAAWKLITGRARKLS